uniref:Uncharacterized protein n=1 Tax=Rangifer tarandus platyrhynchus TaxID=3082113 RepID=A0ACB0DQ36_RANTA|nr:unnamed protein product [Rangifer tarandus platyrhynchus]
MDGYVRAEVASDTLVALSRNHFSLVMYELQHHLKPLNLTEESVIVTLAKLANGNVFEFMPHMGITVATVFTMLRLANEVKMRQMDGYVRAEVASDTLVALSRNHFSLVMYELQHHLKPLSLTEESVIVTLAKLANGNAPRFNRLRPFGLNARPLGGAVVPEPVERTGITTGPAPMRNNFFRFVPVPGTWRRWSCKTANEEGAGPHAGAHAVPSGSCSHRRAIHGVARFGLRVPAFPARVLEHFRPVVKWVSRWVSPGGWAGAAETQGSGLEKT